MLKTSPTEATDPALIISQLRSWAEEQPDSDLARILDSTIEEIEALNLMRGSQERQRVKEALDAGNWTVAHLREATGLTDFAVRRELRRLVSEGMVRVDQSGRAELFVPV